MEMEKENYLYLGEMESLMESISRKGLSRDELPKALMSLGAIATLAPAELMDVLNRLEKICDDYLYRCSHGFDQAIAGVIGFTGLAYSVLSSDNPFTPSAIVWIISSIILLVYSIKWPFSPRRRRVGIFKNAVSDYLNKLSAGALG